MRLRLIFYLSCWPALLVPAVSFGQFSLGVHTAAHAGFTRLKWDAHNLGTSTVIREKWTEADYLFGLTGKWSGDDSNFLDLVYEWQRTNISDKIEMADKMNEHHLLIGYSREKEKKLSGAMGVFRIYSGATITKTKDTAPLLISYTSPHTYITSWRGYLFGMDVGNSFYLGASDLRLQATLSYRFHGSYLAEAKRSFDSRPLEISGHMRTSEFGITLSLIFANDVLRIPHQRTK